MKTKQTLLLCLLALLSFSNIHAARVDTLQILSPSMNKEIKVVVIIPDVALGKKPIPSPAVYLLHGYGGQANSWLKTKPNLPQIADEKGIFFVCPDGQNSWYWDSPINKAYCYETFITNELIRYIDTHYTTVPDRKARAITGLSMGGHGALWNAMRHKEVFGAAGSTSGGVDIRAFSKNWEIAKLLGEFAANKKQWDEHTVITQVNSLQNGELALIIDCGEDDFFLEVNKSLHERLLGKEIDHDFILRPGAHNHAYWNNSIDYQILFFDKFFHRK